MIEVEIPEINVAKPCPKCGVLPELKTSSGWKVAECPVCGMYVQNPTGDMNDVIGKWNRKVEEAHAANQSEAL